MFYCITNPSSRSGAAQGTGAKLSRLLEKNGIPYKMCYTAGPGDGRRIAAEISKEASASGEEITLAVLGGDGTINEVLNGITDFSKIRFAIVPVGSANDFARGLALPENEDELLERVAENEVRRTLDLGRLTYLRRSDILSRLHPDVIPDEQIFGYSAGIGFDAAVTEEALKSRIKDFLNKVHLGSLTYGVIGLRQMLKARKTACDIELDSGEKIHFDNIFFAAAMNLPYEGGGYPFAPDADGSDGKLNLLIVGNLPRARAMLSFPAAKKGKIYSIKGTYHYTCSRVRIRTAEPMWVHTDGEVSMKSDEIEFAALPGKLRLIV